jgi:hypothetical protein
VNTRGTPGNRRTTTTRENPCVCRGYRCRTGNTRSACHAEGRGFESLQPLSKRPAFAGLFRGRSRLVRLRHRTMTGQACLWRLASAIGRGSLAGDSERPAPWNFCVPAADWESTAPVRCPAAPAPLRFVRGRSAAFVEEQHSQPALLRVVHRDSAAAVAVARLLLPRERKPLRVGVDPPDPRPCRRQVVAARRRRARPPHDALTRAAGAG